MKSVLQVPMVQVAVIPVLILSFVVFLIAIAVLWRRGKTVEALVWNSLLLYAIALILLLK